MVMAAVIGGGAILGAGASIYGASKAADAQKSAADKASATQMAMYNQTRSDLQPFVQAGTDATNKLTGQIDSLTAPFSMTQANLEATPGYQFNLSQGLKSTQNSAAARGLGLSGAAMKGAASYATGLADSTYQSQFNMDQTSKTNTFNKLLGTSQLGANAANQTGSYGTTTAGNIGQNTIGAGNATAGAYMAGANGVSSAANGLGNYYMQNRLMQNMGGLYGTAGAYGGMSNYNALLNNPLGM
jgi:hypothetical protein